MCPFSLSSFDLITLTPKSYFSSGDWAEDNTRCGHCDNCTRDPTSVIESDVTLDAKRILAVARALRSKKIKVTAAQLAETARGSGRHAKLLQLGTSDQTKLSSHVCVSCSFGMEFTQAKMQDSDILIDHMLLKKFLDKSVTCNAYKVQVYVEPGALSHRLDQGNKLCIQLPVRVARNKQRAREGGGAGGKRKNANVEDVVKEYGEGDGEDRIESLEDAPESSSAKRRRRSSNHQSSSSSVPAAALEMDFDSDVEGNDADGDPEYESEDLEWKANLRGAPVVTHRTLRNKSNANAQRQAGAAPLPSEASEVNALPIYDEEVIDISSD